MHRLIWFLVLGTLVSGSAIAQQDGRTGRVLVVDDFESPGRATIGTRWQGFTDRVMGGISTIEAGYQETGEGTILSMRGEVSLANNGGFIQVRLPLGTSRPLDASDFDAVAIEARGTPGSYFVHLRTQQTRAPWQHYAANLPIEESWKRIVISFSDFTGDSIRQDLDTRELVSVAIVAGEQEFAAAIDVRRIELMNRNVD